MWPHEYRCVVRAIRTSGGKYVTVKSDGSVDASGASIGTAQTFTLQIAPDTLPVTPVTSAPTGLVATATSSRINLSWNATPGAMSYNVRRAPTSVGPYAIIASNVTATTNYSDSLVSAGTTYYYVVSAVNSGGESSNSAPVSVIFPLVLSEGRTVTASSQQSGNEAFKGCQ